MLKPHSGQEATGRDVHEILGDLDDGTVVAILRLHPTVAQLEEVRLRLNGGDDTLGQRPLGGVVTEMLDMPSAKSCEVSDDFQCKIALTFAASMRTRLPPSANTSTSRKSLPPLSPVTCYINRMARKRFEQ
jgi:hypothetical protein